MQIAQELSLLEIFAASAAARRREILFFERSEREFEHHALLRRREKERQASTDEAILATTEQLAAFRDRLDHYDTAIVDALMDNERRQDEVRHRRDDIDAKAYRLPDGRMAFKSDDGQHMVDEQGAALSPDLIDPRSVPDNVPRWSDLEAVRREERRLAEEREQLHEFQKKVDDARDTADKGGVTKKQIDDLDQDLQASMPDAVRQKMPGHDTSIARSAPQPSDSSQAASLPGESPGRRAVSSPIAPR